MVMISVLFLIGGCGKRGVDQTKNSSTAEKSSSSNNTGQYKDADEIDETIKNLDSTLNDIDDTTEMDEVESLINNLG